MKQYDIVALGEILIDFTPLPPSDTGMAVFEQNPGGAPANVLASATKLGCSTAFIGKVGKDNQGNFLRNTLVQAGIDTKGLISDPNYFTTLAFVSISESGERSFSFSRKSGADTMLREEELHYSLIENTTIFHFGSLSLTHSPSREATISAIQRAKKRGAIISFDPNYRASLWESELQAKKAIESVYSYVDIIKISEEECELVTGETNPQKAVNYLLNQISAAAVSLGENGVLIGNHQGVRKVEGLPCSKVVDTTGAGDTFWGAILSKIGKSGKRIEEFTLEQWAEMARFANAAGSISVEKRGAIPSMPTLEEVDLFLLHLQKQEERQLKREQAEL